jgi:signal transduction histidine kinase
VNNKNKDLKTGQLAVSDKPIKTWQLAMLFAAVTFVILVMTMVFVLIIMLVCAKFGKSEWAANFNIERTPVLMFALGSVVVGTVVSACFAKVPLSPLRTVIDAADRLSEGDFTVRIDLKGSSELKQLSKSFNHMAEELGSIELMRNDFVNNFSHEFKTPIVSIKGFAKLLERDDLTPEERKEYTQIIISESDRLTDLASNVLLLSKLENQTIVTEKKKFNVSEQIRKMLAAMENRADERKMQLSFEGDDCFIYGNEYLLYQVWQDLTDNAMKYSPDGTGVEITAKIEKNDFVFTVTDHGKGMNEWTAEHAFDKYFRGDHTGAGTGLGLTICKRIVDLHSGTISILSTGQQGTSICVRLPGSIPKTLDRIN